MLNAPPVGPAQSYTFVSGDASDPASWYGSGASVKVLMTWTPTISGSQLLLGPVDTLSSSYQIYIWKGDVANVDYPDGTAASGSFSGNNQVNTLDGVQSTRLVSAGLLATFLTSHPFSTLLLRSVASQVLLRRCQPESRSCWVILGPVWHGALGRSMMLAPEATLTPKG
jgi:hypothetical protein